MSLTVSGLHIDFADCEVCSEVSVFVPVVFLIMPVIVLFALYPGIFALSQIAR